METMLKQIRITFITLLDDENGVNDIGYDEMRTLAEYFDENCCADIFAAAEVTDGRYYLPENHGIKA